MQKAISTIDIRLQPYMNSVKFISMVFFVMMLFYANISFGQDIERSFDLMLFEKHDAYKEKSLKNRRFKHNDLIPLIKKIPLDKTVVGRSFEGRDIYKITLGSGPMQVLLWSQMHGDEPTATMAIMDILNWFVANDEFNDVRAAILNKMTLHFVPMLNPDGAEKYIRRTTLGIDMNRDALRFQTPEGRILKMLQDELKPDISYNLHDQSTRYSVGMTNKQATISFLASSYDYERSWNDTRIRAAQLICSMNESIQKIIPGHVGRYYDDHEPRAFGDNIAKWGSTLILIESGGYKEDIEKQFIRKLNFVAILKSFQSLVNKNLANYTLEDYHAIPTNERFLFDLLIRNVVFVENGQEIIKDIGINLTEVTTKDFKSFTVDPRIADLGDLSIFFGIEELDATGMQVMNISNFAELASIYNYKDTSKKLPELNDKANFVLVQNNRPVWTVYNGRLYKDKK